MKLQTLLKWTDFLYHQHLLDTHNLRISMVRNSEVLKYSKEIEMSININLILYDQESKIQKLY
jgi:hypothetical protein